MKGADLAYRIQGTWVDKILSDLGLRKTIQKGYEIIEFRINSGTVRIDFDGLVVTVPTNSRQAFAAVRHLARTERPILEDFASEMRPGDVVYDIGAHVGLYATVAAAKLPDETVFAFEFLPENASCLREHAPENVAVIEQAISDEVGMRTYDANTKKEGTVTARLTNERHDGSVRTTTIDQFVHEGNPQPTIIKIDVEGHEDRVISAASKSLSSPECRIVFIEVHNNSNRKTITDELSKYEFEINLVHQRGDQLFLKATK